MKNLKIFTNNIEESAKEQIDLLLEQEPFKECKIRIKYWNKRLKKSSQNSKTNKMQIKNNKKKRITICI